MIERLRQATGLDVYPASVTSVEGATYFLARRGPDKLLGAFGPAAALPHAAKAGRLDDAEVLLGPTDAANAAALRRAVSWTAPTCLGLATSAGMGDRLGLATPGHVRAVRGTGLRPIFAQQSIREMTRTGRTPQRVLDEATWGVFQEGFRDGFGADADHLQQPADVDATAAAGFTLFTIDPGRHVVAGADGMSGTQLAERFARVDFDALGTTAGELRLMYVGRRFPIQGAPPVEFDEPALLRAAVKYGAAVAHTAAMFHRVLEATTGPFELEVSVDETDSPTTPAEHLFIATELRRLGVTWVSLAPRFVGRFEKGVDYLGNLDAFGASFARHVAVMRTVGPYKLSIHSGSDKFSIYPIVTELAGGLVHLKTAGTSWLEALRAIGRVEPALFRDVLDFARQRYQTDKATYHVSADVAKVPAGAAVPDADLPALLDDFHARQVLHVTYGSVLMADEGERFGRRIYEVLRRDEEAHYAAVEAHLRRHLQPFAGK